MNEKDFVQLLRHLLSGVSVENSLECAFDQPEIGLGPEDIATQTFGEARLLTNNEGIVVTMPDGSKFQVTVVECS